MPRPTPFSRTPEQLLESARKLRAQADLTPQAEGEPTPMVIRYARLFEAIADPASVEAEDNGVVSAEEFEARRRRNTFKLV
jgi:hypothetical protein